MNNNILLDIQDWYNSQCNGEWEHQYGIKIDTLDNPGWLVTIDIKGTDLEGKKFDSIELEHSENDWIHCNIDKEKFTGYCGISNLIELLNIFNNWTQQ